jgi:SAM-dependent methyltransferase
MAGERSATGMTADEYESWYRTPRGRWIADTEYRLLARHLAARRNETVLDIGAGTGQFTRRFAAEGHPVIAVDTNCSWLQFAARNRAGEERFVAADATRLPLADKSMDVTVSVTALCFIRDQRRAIAELIRVTRRRFALGLLNRRSLLFREKGRSGGAGAYAGAHWHTEDEAHALFADLPVENLRVQTAIASASGGVLARAVERLLPSRWPWGAFLVISGDVSGRLYSIT